ncbi:hypothetical protein VINI7043_09866 [Vibrio nigripulchritudo ATCC 27043]|nr:hypothetical protein VINI7043_09866 [Vibrio nigripulchritudo ATCC 27043]
MAKNLMLISGTLCGAFAAIILFAMICFGSWLAVTLLLFK